VARNLSRSQREVGSGLDGLLSKSQLSFTCLEDFSRNLDLESAGALVSGFGKENILRLLRLRAGTPACTKRFGEGGHFGVETRAMPSQRLRRIAMHFSARNDTQPKTNIAIHHSPRLIKG